MDEMMNFADLLSSEENLKPLMNVIESIMGMDDANLNEQTLDLMKGMINGAFTPKVHEESIVGLVEGFKENGYNAHQVKAIVDTFATEIDNVIEEMKPSAPKHELLDCVFGIFKNLFQEAYERFNTVAITLPFKLDEGAKLPTYAHESDACADVYAAEDVVVKAHTVGNLVRTGLHIALPEGWQARLLPRSSTGAKTPLRLSNSCAVVDTCFRGEIMGIFDNNSDSDYQIKAGDRIMQMWVEPVYRFRPQVMDELPVAAERNNEGIGSTGR